MRTLIRTMFLCCLLTVSVGLHAQINYSGIVKDADNAEPVSYAAVGVLGTTIGEMTNDNGEFRITARPGQKLVISFLGYKADTITLSSRRYLDIKLRPEATMLKEVVVVKKKYRNKNNPAVELIRHVIDNKNKNRRPNDNLTLTRRYDKTMFAINGITDDFKQKKILTKINFVFDNTDTTLMEGKEILPFYVREEINDKYVQLNPSRTKTRIEGEKMVRVNGLDVDNEGLAQYSKYMYQDIDIYANTIQFLTNGFLSPVASTAPTFYRYYIQDTLMVDNYQCIKLFFASRNKADQLFTGNLYIVNDSSYAIKKVEMTVDGRININWVRSVNIQQEFENNPTHGWMLKKDYLLIDFIFTEKSMGVVGERSQLFEDRPVNNLTETQINEIFAGNTIEKMDGYDSRDAAYWQANRLEPLPITQESTYDVMDSVQKVPVVKNIMKTGDIIVRGYIDCGKYEIGPLYGFYGYNAVEGHRVRFGGRTTSLLSKRYNFEAYAAYGFLDEKWKYYGKTGVSFTKNSIFEFPVRSISLSYYKDTRRPGQESNVNENALFKAIGRHTNHKLYYDETITLEHLFEFNNHFSYTLGLKYMLEHPGGDIYFNRNNYSAHTNDINYLNMSEVYLHLRFAPHEKFYQGRTTRHPLPSKHPVYYLDWNMGNKAWGNEYNYHKFAAGINKRIYLSVLGEAKCQLEAGYVLGSVGFPALTTHPSNQSWLYIDAYNLMNYLEFVSDRYVSLWIDYSANGFFLNKIPLLRRLKLREVATIKALYGELSSQNNPAKHADLLKLPVQDNGVPMTYSLDGTPYIEGSVGIANIFKILRIDFVKRFTHLDNPDVSEWGIRAKLDLDF